MGGSWTTCSAPHDSPPPMAVVSQSQSTASEEVMKVLYLATERLSPASLTMHKFLDEEIYALRGCGVEPHLLSSMATRKEELNGVYLHPIPSNFWCNALLGIAAPELEFSHFIRCPVPR
jgi:hypothetical protein